MLRGGKKKPEKREVLIITWEYSNLKADRGAFKRISIKLLKKLATCKDTIRELENNNWTLAFESQLDIPSSKSLETLGRTKWRGRARRKAPKYWLSHELSQIDVPEILQ